MGGAASYVTVSDLDKVIEQHTEQEKQPWREVTPIMFNVVSQVGPPATANSLTNPPPARSTNPVVSKWRVHVGQVELKKQMRRTGRTLESGQEMSITNQEEPDRVSLVHHSVHSSFMQNLPEEEHESLIERNSTSFTCPQLQSTMFNQTVRDSGDYKTGGGAAFSRPLESERKTKTSLKDDSSPRNNDQSPQPLGHTTVGASFRHRNSNQNLYSKEVFVKYNHRNVLKRVVMKVSSNPTQRRK